jgi:DNA-binding response OmpR family regulator
MHGRRAPVISHKINKNYFVIFIYFIFLRLGVARIIASRTFFITAERQPAPSPLPAAGGVRRVGDLVLDPAQWCAWRDGQDLRLTRTEFALLWALAATPGRPCSRQQLSRQVWGSPDTGNTNLVAVCVRRLRRKLEPDPAHPTYIQTVRHKGYMLNSKPAD